ncbi:Uncharacterised protein [Burkholderia oklahomensis]|nr:hypothetical protein BG90_5630 [Burkholderia oklahomensis C6786]SUY26602.1 Uncharacterised protein [Burkholderia oklahomensis]
MHVGATFETNTETSEIVRPDLRTLDNPASLSEAAAAPLVALGDAGGGHARAQDASLRVVVIATVRMNVLGTTRQPAARSPRSARTHRPQESAARRHSGWRPSGSPRPARLRNRWRRGAWSRGTQPVGSGRFFARAKRTNRRGVDRHTREIDLVCCARLAPAAARATRLILRLKRAPMAAARTHFQAREDQRSSTPGFPEAPNLEKMEPWKTSRRSHQGIRRKS